MEEIWKAEKASLQGSATSKNEMERARNGAWNQPVVRRDLAKMSELQYGRIPELEKNLKARHSAAGKADSFSCATKSPKKKLPKWFQNGPIFPFPK